MYPAEPAFEKDSLLPMLTRIGKLLEKFVILPKPLTIFPHCKLSEELDAAFSLPEQCDKPQTNNALAVLVSF